MQPTTSDSVEIAQFLRTNILRYSDIYFLDFTLLQTADTHSKLRHVLLQASVGGSLDPDCSWLIGTEDCHLCTLAQADYLTASAAHALPALQAVDVLGFEPTLMALIAPNIPVLITKETLLVYPFGLMDIIALVQH